MLKRLFLVITFLLTCATAQAQEGIFVAASCAARIPAPVINKVICFDLGVQSWLGYNGAWVVIGGSEGGATTDDQVASEVPYDPIPGGNLSATNVQTAIQELDAEKQPLDSDLTALGANSTNGIWARTGTGTGAARTITAGSSKLSVSNGNGVSGNPTLDVVTANLLLQNAGGAVTDAQVPDLDTLGTGLTPSKCVETDASGLLVSAADVCGSGGSGSPGGADTQIQFNDGGSFGGEADFTWDKTTNTLTVGDCATNCITDDPSEITGTKTRTRLNASGYETASDAVLTDGELPVANSSGVLVDSGLTVARLEEFSIVFLSERDDGLADTDDRAKFYPNLGVTKTITQVKCWTDTGTSTVNLQRDDGTAADILASNLVCSTSGASTTSFTSGENIISSGHNIDFVMVTAATSGTPTKVTVAILGTK